MQTWAKWRLHQPPDRDVLELVVIKYLCGSKHHGYEKRDPEAVQHPDCLTSWLWLANGTWSRFLAYEELPHPSIPHINGVDLMRLGRGGVDQWVDEQLARVRMPLMMPARY